MDKNNYVGIYIVLAISIIAVTVYVTMPKLLMASFEVEGSCNSGNIGVDFQSDFANEKYKDKHGYDYNFTRYNNEIIPKKLNLKNIDGVTCTYKVKGNLPIMALIDKWQEIQAHKLQQQK